jgi:hypothetical protein
MAAGEYTVREIECPCPSFMVQEDLGQGRGGAIMFYMLLFLNIERYVT